MPGPVPAHQRLETADRTCPGLDLRLVVQLELVVGQALAQIALEPCLVNHRLAK